MEISHKLELEHIHPANYRHAFRILFYFLNKLYKQPTFYDTKKKKKKKKKKKMEEEEEGRKRRDKEEEKEEEEEEEKKE
ncbi:hypothetical protein PoB_000947800 [Plakobranchus ocellatus]|uniref:Uncharacterized protein n=1 Tax=Plakobranchus ocellatus TaxID=259542 RepID=A0AAV3YL85_9GAST|nr:hypothetical protein PoB_000947800 [Plakobranchus ocellatus]